MIIRKANIGDAPLIARCVLDAVGVRDFNSNLDRALLEAITAECMRPDSLYSYTHSSIAELDGEAVGRVVAYPGEIYSIQWVFTGSYNFLKSFLWQKVTSPKVIFNITSCNRLSQKTRRDISVLQEKPSAGYSAPGVFIGIFLYLQLFYVLTDTSLAYE